MTSDTFPGPVPRANARFWPLQRFSWYAACQIAGWGLQGIAGIILSVSTAPADAGVYALLFAWAMASGLLLSHRWRTWLKPRLARDQETGLPWVALVLGVLGLTAVQTLNMTAAFALARPAGAFEGWAWLPNALVSWFFIFLLWTTLYCMVHVIRRNQRLAYERLQLSLAARESELRALQAQVNPHFYFNSLNSLRALIFVEPTAAAATVDRLAALMRHALESSRRALVPLDEEFAAIRHYLAIEKIRFEERLQFEFDVAPNVGSTLVPPMVLQTLVENAVKYGVERSPVACSVRVLARPSARGLTVEVCNEGTLVASGSSTGLGLDNARRRLALSCGPRASLELTADAGVVRATLFVPATS